MAGIVTWAALIVGGALMVTGKAAKRETLWWAGWALMVAVVIAAWMRVLA